MNGNFLGMDPELAKQAMVKIQAKKVDLERESKNSSASLTDKVNNAFTGTQTSSMNDFIARINVALEKLYAYLDGNESNFAQKFNEVIQSYITSDENVSQSYSNSNVE